MAHNLVVPINTISHHIIVTIKSLVIDHPTASHPEHRPPSASLLRKYHHQASASLFRTHFGSRQFSSGNAFESGFSVDPSMPVCFCIVCFEYAYCKTCACQGDFYCSAQCQAQHWQVHKHYCAVHRAKQELTNRELPRELVTLILGFAWRGL